MEKDREAQQSSTGHPESWYPDKTVLKPLTTMSNSMSAQISAIDVKDGKILRIRPLHLDEKYKKEELGLWEIKGRGLTFAPPIKTVPHHFSYCHKNRVYSPNRIKYPLLRVDWDINSTDRKTLMRGISKYKRISWDEATDIMVKELKRIREKYGDFDSPCPSP